MNKKAGTQRKFARVNRKYRQKSVRDRIRAFFLDNIGREER
jgi:hypothetical protein